MKYNEVAISKARYMSWGKTIPPKEKSIGFSSSRNLNPPESKRSMKTNNTSNPDVDDIQGDKNRTSMYNRIYRTKKNPRYYRKWSRKNFDYKRNWRAKNKTMITNYYHEWLANHPDCHKNYRKRNSAELQKYWREHKRKSRRMAGK
jgi:hypothetical protein